MEVPSFPAVDPADFGAAADGRTDDTDAFARAVDASGGKALMLAGRSYALREIEMRPDMIGLFGPGRLIGRCATDGGILRMNPAAETCRTDQGGLQLRDLAIELGKARCGIELFGAVGCTIRNCSVICSRDLQKGIWIRDNCHSTTVTNCRITAPSGELRSLVCLTVESEPTPGTAGYFQGTGGRVVYGESSGHTLIEGNVIEGGTHGIALGEASRNRIVHNRITNSGHRNINICPASRGNIVACNQLLEAGSSAVAMAYGSSDNIVADNQIESWSTVPDADRDAIHAYVASQGNRIAGNHILGSFRYGVYLAVGARCNMVLDNRIRLDRNPDVPGDWNAAIAIESDWPARPLPKEARFSRRNFGPAPPGYRWAYQKSGENMIRGNLIERADCGVYLAQFARCALGDNVVEGNHCLANVPEPHVRYAQPQ